MQPPRAQGLASVTVDSSLMYPTTTRRFLMALWEMEGLRIELVPRTAQEMYGMVRESEREQWYRRLRWDTKRTGRVWAPESVEKIIDAAQNAAGQWVNAELGYGKTPGRNDSMLHAVTLSAKQGVEAAAIAAEIPRRCFRGPTKNNYRGDREIVAQAVISGFKILASDNRWSIVRNRMNGWLAEQSLVEEELVLNADDAIEKAGPWRTQANTMLEAVLRATLPNERRSAEREAEFVTTFVKRLGRQGLEGVSLSCLDAWEGPDHETIYKAARAHIEHGGKLSRMTEDRRLEAVRSAAAGAGYVR